MFVQEEVKLLTVKLSTPFDKVIDAGKLTENVSSELPVTVKLSALVPCAGQNKFVGEVTEPSVPTVIVCVPVAIEHILPKFREAESCDTAISGTIITLMFKEALAEPETLPVIAEELTAFLLSVHESDPVKLFTVNLAPIGKDTEEVVAFTDLLAEDALPVV